jgi:hypothetical protein
MKRSLPILDLELVSSMQTKALLGRLARLQQCEASASLSDATPQELAGSTGIHFKDTPEWRTAHEELKQVLATREHVPGGAETEAARLEGAAANQTKERRRRR